MLMEVHVFFFAFVFFDSDFAVFCVCCFSASAFFLLLLLFCFCCFSASAAFLLLLLFCFLCFCLSALCFCCFSALAAVLLSLFVFAFSICLLCREETKQESKQASKHKLLTFGSGVLLGGALRPPQPRATKSALYLRHSRRERNQYSMVNSPAQKLLTNQIRLLCKLSFSLLFLC